MQKELTLVSDDYDTRCRKMPGAQVGQENVCFPRFNCLVVRLGTCFMSYANYTFLKDISGQECD